MSTNPLTPIEETASSPAQASIESIEPMAGEGQLEKQAAWQRTADGLTAELGLGLDPGIKETVIVLQVLGFNTIGSCEGHTDRLNPWSPYVVIVAGVGPVLKLEDLKDLEEHGEDSPIYEIVESKKKANLEESAKLEQLLEEFYHGRVTPLSVRLTITGKAFEAPQLESQGAANPKLYQLDENELYREIPKYQAEMAAFTQFLKSKYFGSVPQSSDETI